ncbi:DNA alkylation repair protein [Aestuariibius sp. 2305UL40-4]|uniref:DNA alkylation repair protein n=1 Tax=Aestuariibius violaceus TaxID=3234132 RepID=UPI00345E6D9F
MADRAAELIAALSELADPEEVPKVRKFFRGADPETQVMGVSIGKVFPVAKRFADLSLDDIERLLEDPHYEVRMAAVSVMDFQARQKRLDPERRKALYNLYLHCHDRINNWDLVDRAAPHVIGEYLIDKDRSVLDRMAGSDDPNARRTAIVATHAFLKRGEVADTFRIAEVLAEDKDTYVQKAIGSWTREAGKRDEAALRHFLDRNANRLPRPTVTAASKPVKDERAGNTHTSKT